MIARSINLWLYMLTVCFYLPNKTKKNGRKFERIETILSYYLCHIWHYQYNMHVSMHLPVENRNSCQNNACIKNVIIYKICCWRPTLTQCNILPPYLMLQRKKMHAIMKEIEYGIVILLFCHLYSGWALNKETNGYRFALNGIDGMRKVIHWNISLLY